MIYILQTGQVMSLEKTKIIKDEQYTYLSFGDIEKSEKAFLAKCTPIGSVAFVKKIMSKLAVRSCFTPFPESIWPYLKRNLQVKQFSDVLEEEFCKPVELKKFTGNIKKDIEEEIEPNTMVYVSNTIKILAEWRFYIYNNTILGFSRYDDNDQEYLIDSKSISFVEQILKSMKSKCVGFSVDVGLKENGELFLIELNDGYSLGYYPWGNCSFKDYLKLIDERWKQLCINAKID